MGAGLLDVAIRMSLIGTADTAIRGLMNRMFDLGRATDATRKQFDAMMGAAKSAALLAIGTRALYQGMKPGVTAAGELQTALFASRAELTRMGDTAETLSAKILKVRETAAKMQQLLPMSEVEAVRLQTYMARMGIPLGSIIGQHGAASAAAGLGTYLKIDPESAAEMINRFAVAYHVKGEGYWDIADTIARASAASQVSPASFQMMGQYAAELASFAKFPMKDFITFGSSLAAIMTPQKAGTTLRALYSKEAQHGIFWDTKTGSIMAPEQLLKRAQELLKGQTVAVQMNLIDRWFGMRGEIAPIKLMMDALKPGSPGSLEYIMETMKKSLSLANKLKIALEPFDQQMKVYQSSKTTMLSELYQSALPPLTSLVKIQNWLVNSITDVQQHNNSLGKGLVYGGAALMGLGAIGTIGFGLQAFKNFKALGGLNAIFGTGAGIWRGKVIAGATGVTPVYVVNMSEVTGPMGASMLGANPGTFATVLRGALGVTFAFAVGWEIGTVINSIIEKYFPSSDRTGEPGNGLTEKVTHQSLSGIKYPYPMINPTAMNNWRKWALELSVGDFRKLWIEEHKKYGSIYSPKEIASQWKQAKDMGFSETMEKNKNRIDISSINEKQRKFNQNIDWDDDKIIKKDKEPPLFTVVHTDNHEIHIFIDGKEIKPEYSVFNKTTNSANRVSTGSAKDAGIGH